MSRNTRRIFLLFAVASGITGAMVAVASATFPRSLLLHDGGNAAYFVGWDSGWVGVWTQEVFINPAAGRDVQISVSTPRRVGFHVAQADGHGMPGVTSSLESDFHLPSSFGLRWGQTRLMNGTIGGVSARYSFYGRARTFQAQSVYVAVAAIAPGVFLLFRQFTRRRQTQAGHCTTCGYDLRATPDRCPECGAVRETATKERGRSSFRTR